MNSVYSLKAMKSDLLVASRKTAGKLSHLLMALVGQKTVAIKEERMEYTITWIIENYSYCVQDIEEILTSPEFFLKGLESSAWVLCLFPRGYALENKGKISLFLERSKVDDGPENIPLKFEFSFLGVDGSAVISKRLGHTFVKGKNYGYKNFPQVHELFLPQKATLLPNDTLSVRCKMWINKGAIQKVGQCSARTRIGTEHAFFIQVVEGFSTLEPNQKKTSEIASSKDVCVTSSIHLADSSCCDGRIIVEITPTSTKKVLSTCNLFLLGASGILTKCGEDDNRFDDTRKDITRLCLSLTRKYILSRKSEYLADDKLTLMCECTFSTGVEYEKVERTLHEIPFFVINQIHNGQKNGRSDVAKKLSACPSALDDLKAFYSTELLTDVKLQTETNSYPAHKYLLCARSPVFKAMLTNDMKEKNTDCIKVDDLDNDAIEKLLHFLYSDSLENIQWDSAIKLYYAADKYAIEKLKLMCSSILLDSLSTSNAIELLLLADTHSDSTLQGAVCDFIMKHEKEVFCSDEWVKLIETNPVLVSKTMLLKYVRNN